MPFLRHRLLSSNFAFTTGIENSSPTIQLENGQIHRVDEMEKTQHYQRWQEDFHLTREIGIRHLRYGIPLYKCLLGPQQYNWDFTDLTFNELKKLDITPIVDLCHFGVPDWIGSFQNPDFPRLFAQYAGAFARRFPWIQFYTPINEIFITAQYSAKLGLWNERLKTDKAFVTALKHLAQANILAEIEILKVNEDAIFIQSESSEYYHPENQDAEQMAYFYNQIRFLSFDLSYGNDVKATVYQYLCDHGLTRDEYSWFIRHGRKLQSHCVMGNDYYSTNEHLVYPDGHFEPAGEIFGYYVITKQYFDRYHLPVMHTETNTRDNGFEAIHWLRKEWSNVVRLKQDGVPVIGFTWYSLIDQVDWDSLLTKNDGHVNPLGLFDLDRKIRPVGTLYCQLIREWNNMEPANKRILFG